MRNIAMLTNMKDYNVEKEFKAPIPNKIFLGFDYESLKGKDMQQSKIIHLYYSLVLLTPMGINTIPYISLSALCKVTKIKASSTTLQNVKNRLKFLESQGLIKVKADLESLKKNDNFSIEMIFTEELMKNGFTFLNAKEMKLFFKLDVSMALVFLYLKRYYNKEKGYAFVTYENMSDDLSISNTTISNTIEFLIELGVISKENTNFYRKDEVTGQIRKSNNRYFMSANEAIEEAVRKIDNNEVDMKLKSKPKKVKIKKEVVEIIEELKKPIEQQEAEEPVEEVKEIPSLGELIPKRNSYIKTIDDTYLEDVYAENENKKGINKFINKNLPNEIPF